MLVELKSYPMRPVRLAGEGLSGFFYRCHAANGHRMPEQVHQSLEEIYRPTSADATEAAWQLLAWIAQDSLEADRKMWLRNHATMNRSSRERLHEGEFSYRLVRVCPLCLREGGVHLHEWEWPLLRSCTKHGSELINKCACGKRLSWRGLAPGWKCGCGLALIDIHPSTVASHQRALDNFIATRQQTYLSLGSKRSLADIGDPGLVSSPFRTIHVLGELSNQVLQMRKGSRLSRRPHEELVGHLMVRWPVTLNRCLTRLLRHLGSRHHQLLIELTPQLSLGGVYGWLRRQQSDPRVDALLRSLASDLMKDADVPGALLSPVVFNPSTSLLERSKRLLKFKTWWLELFDFPEGPVRPPRRRGDLWASRMADRHRHADRPHWSIINALLDAAWDGVPVQNFRCLAYEWPEQRFSAEQEPLELIAELSRQLQGVAFHHVCRFERVIERCLKHSDDS